MARTTPIHLDRLDHALKGHGVNLKRAQLLETAAYAMGYHNSGEFSAAAKAGDLTPAAAEPIGRIEVAGEALVVLRDPQAGSLYAVDEAFLGQVVEEERRERFGTSPYGHLLDLTDAAGHPATAWTIPNRPSANDAGQPRYMAYGTAEAKVLAETDDLEAAREACRREDGTTDLDTYVVDRHERTISRARCCWRTEPLPALAAPADVAAELFMARAERDEAVKAHETTLRLDVPDWRMWERDLKKASHRRQEPISDEILHQFRHAVADVTCKSSSSEKSQVTYRQARYVDRHLGGLLARLDRAEEALREAGLAPKEIARRTSDDAAETLAAIEAVTTKRPRGAMPGLYEVDATRDGDRCRETFLVKDGEDPEDAGRRIAAKAFRMDLEEHRYRDLEETDGDGNPIPDYSPFDSECDTFSVEPVDYPEAATIISDALGELSMGGGFQHGVPHNHPARIKLVAARRMIEPRPTTTVPSD